MGTELQRRLTLIPRLFDFDLVDFVPARFKEEVEDLNSITYNQNKVIDEGLLITKVTESDSVRIPGRDLRDYAKVGIFPQTKSITLRSSEILEMGRVPRAAVLQ